ncbi:hypothetical protein KP509_31G043400 [Ceratopteris richardii]|uniref:Fungal lipase-type domain-containing protein n=1 Tax=Ceratopteris richardii TaxID=49495 RepID=A0A8T2QZH9_CERRI|nr:hypothetical protein KP509_31G043400 [Ceratopteris richardii]
MKEAASKLLAFLDSRRILENASINSTRRYLSMFWKRALSKSHYDMSTSDESDGEKNDKPSRSSEAGKTKCVGAKAVDDEEDINKRGWNAQLGWLNNVLESALALYKRTVAPGDPQNSAKPATTRSLVDIALNLNKSTSGLQQWSLGDLTFGLYLLSLRHASETVPDVIKGEQVLSPALVAEFVYHAELAKGAYMKDAAALARISMLRESNVIKFVDTSSVMRPAYYIAADIHERLIILGIRGTRSVHDLITDLISHGDEEVAFDGGNVHYGTAKAAEWFVAQELPTLRHIIQKYAGFGLRIVGHSLGGATAALLAMMLRKKSDEHLGFPPSIISAVGFASPPCVSRTLAIRSGSFIRNVVLQDDVVPRINAASVLRLRNEILQLDWAEFVRKESEERKGVLDLVASTVQALSSVQDVARRYRAYASQHEPTSQEEISNRTIKQSKNVITACPQSLSQLPHTEELYVPGTLYHLRGNPIFLEATQKFTEGREGCTLWKADCDDFLRRILLVGSFFKDHKCDSYYQSLRDTLKGLQKI